MLSAQPWAMGASCPVEIILQPCVSFSCLRQGFAESADPGHCCGGEMVICWYLLYSYDIWYIYIYYIYIIYTIYTYDICINVMQGCTFDLPVIQWSYVIQVLRLRLVQSQYKQLEDSISRVQDAWHVKGWQQGQRWTIQGQLKAAIDKLQQTSDKAHVLDTLCTKRIDNLRTSYHHWMIFDELRS